MLILIDEDGNQMKEVVPYILKDNEELEKAIFDFNDSVERITTSNPAEGYWATYYVTEKEPNIYQVSMLRVNEHFSKFKVKIIGV